MPSEREGPCRAMLEGYSGRMVRCRESRGHSWHDPDRVPYGRWAHPYQPRPTLREWLRDVALCLTPPGWVITLGLIASIVALALLFFDAVPR